MVAKTRVVKTQVEKEEAEVVAKMSVEQIAFESQLADLQLAVEAQLAVEQQTLEIACNDQDRYE